MLAVYSQRRMLREIGHRRPTRDLLSFTSSLPTFWTTISSGLGVELAA